jgi:hypothetical protein
MQEHQSQHAIQEKGAKRARVETPEPTIETDVANQELARRPRLNFVNVELSQRLGQKYCDEAELLP